MNSSTQAQRLVLSLLTIVMFTFAAAIWTDHRQVTKTPLAIAEASATTAADQSKSINEESNVKTNSYKLAMGQMLVEGGRPQENMARAVAMIEQASKQDCRVIVLPEALDLGWTHTSVFELAEPIPGPRSDQLAAAAKEFGIYVVAGLTERDGDRIYNSAVLISPQSEMLLKYRKINVLDIAQNLYSIGDRMAVANTSIGTIGVNICADNFSSSLSLGHSLARMGAQIILSPCAWAVRADYDNEKTPYGDSWKQSYSTLAKLYDITVVGVSNVGWMTEGPWKGRKCIGCSLAIGPDGNIIAEGPYGESAEALIVIDINLVEPKAKGTAIAGMLAEKGHRD